MKQLERIHRKLAATPQLSSVLTICGLLLVVFASMCVYSESYRSAYNVTNVLVQCVPLACVSLGQTLVIISGGIDLSKVLSTNHCQLTLTLAIRNLTKYTTKHESKPLEEKWIEAICKYEGKDLKKKK